MIGIALVTFVSVLAQGIRVSNRDAIERQIQSDLIVTSQDGYSEFPAAVGDAVADAGFAETVSNVRQDLAEIGGNGGNVTGLDERASEVYGFRWVEGSDELLGELGADGAVVPNHVAEDRNLAVGDTITVRSTDDETKRVRRPRHLRGQPVLPAPRLRQHLPAGLRRALPTPAKPLHARERRRRPGRLGQGKPRGGGRGLPRHARSSRARSGSRRRTRRSDSS